MIYYDSIEDIYISIKNESMILGPDFSSPPHQIYMIKKCCPKKSIDVIEELAYKEVFDGEVGKNLVVVEDEILIAKLLLMGLWALRPQDNCECKSSTTQSNVSKSSTLILK